MSRSRASSPIRRTNIRVSSSGDSKEKLMTLGKKKGKEKGDAAHFKTDHRRNELTKYFIPLESSCVPYFFLCTARRVHRLQLPRQFVFKKLDARESRTSQQQILADFAR